MLGIESTDWGGAKLVNGNRHGLQRYIPKDISAEVRRRSKYGCVVCRGLIYDYEHIEPEFADAHEHKPEDICLLCPEHHAEVTRGRLSKTQIRRAYELIQNSADVRPPCYRPEITGSLKLGLGDALFEYMPDGASVLEYDGFPVLQVGYVKDATYGGSRPSLTGSIFDEDGKELVALLDNQIHLLAEGVDVTFVGSVLRVCGSNGNASLEMTLSPPDGIRFDRLRMRYGSIMCEMDDTFGLTLPSFGGRTTRCHVSGISTKGARAAISYKSDMKLWNGPQLQIIGGEGIKIPYSGAILAQGAGAMLMPRLTYLAY